MAAINQARPAGTASVRTPLFILGVALALVAFIVMFAFGLLFANKTASGTTITVVAAGQAIAAREPTSPLALKTVSVPQSAVPPQAFTQLSQLSGYYAAVDIPAGQVISSNIVSPNQDQLIGTSSYLDIPPGYVGIAFPSGELIG